MRARGSGVYAIYNQTYSTQMYVQCIYTGAVKHIYTLCVHGIVHTC